MSAQQLPIIQQLRQQQELQAASAAKQLRKSQDQITPPNKTQQLCKSEEKDNKTEVKVVVDETKLFSKKPSIFSVKTQNENKANIFANKKSVNLFNLTTKNSNQNGLNIFTMAKSSQPLIQNELEDDLLSQSSQGPQEDNKEQVMPQPTEKVMKYTYQQKMEKLGEFRVSRFRSGADATKEGVFLLSIQKEKQSNSKFMYLVLRTEATKISIYNAILLENTRVQHFMNKQENIKIWAIRSHKKDDQIITSKQVVKIQFQTLDQAKKFESIVATPEAVKQ